jgi:hypothetical protein
MVGHDTPGIYFQSFLGATVVQAIQYDFTVFGPGKNIYPTHNAVGNKIHPVLVMEFIFPAHKYKIKN